jgi:chloride channel 7
MEFSNEQDSDIDETSDKPKKAVGPVAMGAVGKTLIFPRKDNIFKKKESLPFDEINSLVWQDRPFQKRKEQTKTWLAHFLVGISVGVVAFLMTSMEEYINKSVIQRTQSLIADDNTTWFKSWAFYMGMAAFFAMTASLMTTYYGPGASGSGVAELIGYMNGVNYPDFIGINTLLTKIIGVTLAVTGKLCVGKEGPLAHIGANIGILVLYIPGLGFEFLRNDDKKR